MNQQNAQPDTRTQQEPSWEEMVEDTRAFGDYLKTGGTVGALLGLSEEHNEALYALGHRYYDQGKYSEAFKLFSVLVINDQMEPRYVMALGAASQMLGRYEDALTQYMMATALSIDDPQPAFHAAQCLIQLDRKELAMETLELVMTICERDEVKHAGVIKHTNRLIKQLKSNHN